jgi:hypothetical protein
MGADVSAPSSNVARGAVTMTLGVAIAAASFSYGEIRVGGIGLGIAIIGLAQMTGHA